MLDSQPNVIKQATPYISWMTNQQYASTARHSLAYLETEMERHLEDEKRTSGNRAFAFVLISLGIFTLGIAGIFGLFAYLWPVTLFGSGSLLGGIILRHG